LMYEGLCHKMWFLLSFVTLVETFWVHWILWYAIQKQIWTA